MNVGCIRHRREEARSAALAFPEPPERVAEVVLRCGPLERHPLARPVRERVAVGWSQSRHRYQR